VRDFSRNSWRLVRVEGGIAVLTERSKNKDLGITETTDLDPSTVLYAQDHVDPDDPSSARNEAQVTPA
jgi:hypothetical protein